MSDRDLVERLRRGERPVYIGTRLFDPSGRYTGARVEQGVLRGLRSALAELGLTEQGQLTFLPYRDSNGAIQLAPGESFTEMIYHADIDLIEHSFALIAPLSDLQHDSGVCFEIGYAAAHGVPAVLLALNSIATRYAGVPEPQLVPPVLRELAFRVVAAGDFPVNQITPDAEHYLGLIERHFERVEQASAEVMRELVLGPPPRPPVVPAQRPGTVFLEFGGGMAEYQRSLAEELRERLAKAGWIVETASRYEARTETELATRSRVDLVAAASSEIVVTLAEGADADAESAAVQGFCRRHGCEILMLFSGSTSWWNGPDYDTPRNLMLLHAGRLARSLDELVAMAGRAA